MSKQRGFLSILVLLFIAAIILIAIFVLKKDLKSTPLQFTNKQEEIFYEKIPGSKFHSPDATWWGYNQSKIVRHENKVFMYVVENLDGSNKTESELVIYLKDGIGPWQKGASFPTSRPGNILVDSSGVLHVFVFVPSDVTQNDSKGKLVHYWFPNSTSGDISNFQQETVVEAQEGVETVNIRVGATIGDNDTMAVGFGLTTFNPLYQGHSEHLYLKKPQEASWTHLVAGENLGHDYYYPFVLATRSSFHLLSVQDDFNQGKTGVVYDNIYQKIIYFEYLGKEWRREMIVDLSNHPLADKRFRLLEQSDFFEDSQGKIHILYKEFLDPETQWKTTKIWHLSGQYGNWERKEIEVLSRNIGWIRLIEVERELFYLGTNWNEVYLTKAKSNNWQILETPKDVKAIYPYLSNKGSKLTGDFADVLLLGADSKEYATTSHYYLRIPKSIFMSIK